MAFVQGRLCSECNEFIVSNSGKEHFCPGKKSFVGDILKITKDKNKLFDSFIEEEAIENSTEPCTPIIGSSSKVIKADGVGKEDFYKLISIIETCKPLWDHRLSLGERSENIKNNLWNEVFVQFNGKYSLEGIKNSWKYIRERYTREKKPSASGSEGGNKKVWEHFKNFKFLDDVLLINKRTTDNISQDSISSINESAPPLKRSKKSMVETYMGSLIEELKQTRPITPSEPVLVVPETTKNEDHKFSSYLTDIMSNIPRPQRIKLQGKIISMVIEELNQIS